MSATLTFAKKTPASLATYSVLLGRIRQAINAGKDRAAKAVERELVRSKWETGRLIIDHILLNKERADYGEKVILRLSGDLGTSKRELDYMVSFVRTYPIVPPAAQLSWANQRELLSINEEDQRKDLVKKASKAKWTRKTLRTEIKKLKTAKQITVTPAPEAPKLSLVKQGTLGAYAVIEQEGRLKIDLGFSCYLDAAKAGVKRGKRVKPGDIVAMSSPHVSPTSSPQSSGGDLKPSLFSGDGRRATSGDLYTYNAQVTQVVDGDTFHCLIDLGFGITFQDRVRLRRLNAPEIITTDGQRAKKVLERLLFSSPVGHIVIKVSKTDDHDQYGRYLVDVWANNQNIEQALLASGIFEVRG